MAHCSPDFDMYGAGKTFDINTYRSRYIALEVLYIGWEYQGSTYQEGSQDSIEAGSTTTFSSSFVAVHKKAFVPNHGRPFNSGKYVSMNLHRRWGHSFLEVQ